MKLIFCVLIFLCFVLFGYQNFKKTLKKMMFFDEMKRFCEGLFSEVTFFQNTIKDITKDKNYSQEFKDFLNNYAQNNEILNDDLMPNMDEQDKRQIKGFFKKLGRLDIDSQAQEIKVFQKFLENKQQDLRENDLKKAKLSFSLITMLGLLIFVIII